MPHPALPGHPPAFTCRPEGCQHLERASGRIRTRCAMKNKLAVWLSLFLLACGGVSSATSKSATADEKAVRAAAAQFYSALNKMFTGDLGQMTDVWSHADDV